jgi:hypothetical protein
MMSRAEMSGPDRSGGHHPPTHGLSSGCGHGRTLHSFLGGREGRGRSPLAAGRISRGRPGERTEFGTLGRAVRPRSRAVARGIPAPARASTGEDAHVDRPSQTAVNFEGRVRTYASLVRSAFSAARSGGFARWASNPTSRQRSRSSGCAYPVSATRRVRRSASSSRIARATS